MRYVKKILYFKVRCNITVFQKFVKHFSFNCENNFGPKYEGIGIFNTDFAQCKDAVNSPFFDNIRRRSKTKLQRDDVVAVEVLNYSICVIKRYVHTADR